MQNKKLAALSAILSLFLVLCTGCGASEANPLGEASAEISAVASESTVPDDAVPLQSEKMDFSVSLQGDLESGTLEVVLTRNGESQTCSTPTLNGFASEELTEPVVEPFSGMMGHSGFCETHPRAGSSWSERYYYATDWGADDSPVCIAESYGYGQNDYSIDLDGDGVTELVCNCSYTSTGTEDVFVYREADGCIWKSAVDKAGILSEDGVPTDAVLVTSHGLSYYDGGQELFFFSYPNENWDWLDQEILWPEDFAEAAYEPSYTVAISDEIT